jgi:hypothetical protein
MSHGDLLCNVSRPRPRYRSRNQHHTLSLTLWYHRQIDILISTRNWSSSRSARVRGKLLQTTAGFFQPRSFRRHKPYYGRFTARTGNVNVGKSSSKPESLSTLSLKASRTVPHRDWLVTDKYASQHLRFSVFCACCGDQMLSDASSIVFQTSEPKIINNQ